MTGMRIQLTDPATGKTKTHKAELRTDRAESRYNQPVIVVDGDWVLDVAAAELRAAKVLKQPTDPSQVEMLKWWQANARAVVGTTGQSVEEVPLVQYNDATGTWEPAGKGYRAKSGASKGETEDE